jgi:hypothetical protein
MESALLFENLAKVFIKRVINEASVLCHQAC